MMNDLAEAMREAAEILHEIGGYSALVDDLRYGAAELEAQKPVAQSKNGQLFWCGDPTEYRGVDCDLFLAPQTPAEPVAWEYYYKKKGCSAKNAHDPDCICWHKEGTGPYDNERHDSTSSVIWRPAYLAPPAAGSGAMSREQAAAMSEGQEG